MDKGLFSGVLREPLGDSPTVSYKPRSRTHCSTFYFMHSLSLSGDAMRRVGALVLSSACYLFIKVHDA